MAGRYFGELPNVPVGAPFHDRAEVRAAGVHLPLQAGISGTAREGADSIVVNGGYVDDRDYGDEIIYTGAGGQDARGNQMADQEITYTNNAGLVKSELDGLPVRVVRGPDGAPQFSPQSGYRYDGLFRVASHWSETGQHGFRIWRFQLVRLGNDEITPSFTLDRRTPPGAIQPGMRQGVITRIVRSTAVAEWVKALYDQTCQVCGTRLDLPSGLIAEGAHIRPLGRPHYGPDVVENILCMCPNHHSLFDRGGIYIADDLSVRHHTGKMLATLTVAPSHEIDLAQIGYHRGMFGF